MNALLGETPEARGEEMLKRAREIAPLVEAAGAEIERESRLPQRVLDAIVEAGLFKLITPRELGGSEADLLSYVRCAEVLGAADASTGWCFVQAGHAGFTLAPRIERSQAHEFFGGPRAVLAAGTMLRPGRADVVDGGYLVSGEWSFGSGCMHATCFDARAFIWRDGEPVKNEQGVAPVYSMVVPKAEVEIIEGWDVRGMRGTGSHTFRVHGAFVPTGRAVEMYGSGSWADIPICRVPGLGAAHMGFASMTLGAAGAMLDDFITLAGTKTPFAGRVRLGERSTVQETVARMRGVLRGAQAFRDQASVGIWEEAKVGRVSIAARTELRLASIHALDASVEIADVIYRAAGTTAIFGDNVMQRRFQDIHVAAQQLFGRTANYENVGKFLLGMEGDRGAL